MSYDSTDIDRWHRDVPKSSRAAVVAGFVLLAVFGFGFGTWAALAPLEGAVVAHGTFVATSQNKNVQHLEGGILRQVFVKEGDLVEAGQVLARFDDTNAYARLRRLELRAWRLVISRARLEAEIEGKGELAVPVALASTAETPEIAAMLSRQRIELAARRTKLAAEQDVLRKEIAGLQESIAGYKVQLAATNTRVTLFGEELAAKKQLYERELARKTDLLALQRAEVSLHGEIGQLTGRIADAQERIARAEQQITSLHSTAIQKAIEELRQAETEIDDIAEQIRAANDIVQRVDVRAPLRGAVVKINHHSVGGVVGPGEVILELLPVNDELVIEARISPSEVAQVKTGQQAHVRLTALKQRLTPIVAAEVVYLSPDTVAEATARPRGSEPPARRDTFVVRMKLDPADKFVRSSQAHITPGMPADVYIKTEERTFFEYILRPVFDSFSRAFRER